jgi:flavin-dependent dehydrogenase
LATRYEHDRAKFDTVVVGAGPAGASLAIRLARMGFHIALVDKKVFPRQKPCGEFMSPACLPLLDELGVGDTVRGLGAQLVRGMQLHGFGRRASGRYGPLGRVQPLFAHGLAVRRDRFDHALFRAAASTQGVQIFEKFDVVSLLRDRGDAVVGVVAMDQSGRRQELRAPFTVGADGLRSRVARLLGVQRSIPWLKKFALLTRYDGVEVDDCAELHFFPGGYFVGCPVDGGLFSLNLIIDQRQLKRSRYRAEEFLHRQLQLCPPLAHKLASARRVDPIRGFGPLAGSTSRQVVDGAALVGDACGHVDPVTGEGIFFALQGAADLARSLTTALHAGRRDHLALTSYLRARRRKILPRLRFGRLLQRGMRHPLAVRSLLQLLQSHPRLADILVTITGDYAPLRELARPSVWYKNNGAKNAK